MGVDVGGGSSRMSLPRRTVRHCRPPPTYYLPTYYLPPPTSRSGNANTYIRGFRSLLISGVMPAAALPTSDVPVLTATYCFPFTEYAIGYPLIESGSVVCHSTLPVLSSSAWKRPSTSPTRISPPPVATSGMTPARCSCFQSVLPVSAEIAHTVPTLSAPGDITYFVVKPYTFVGSRWSVFDTAVMHMFCSG